jgi:hypothetical protein
VRSRLHPQVSAVLIASPDPPPIILLRLYEISDWETPRESEREIEYKCVVALIHPCPHADLTGWHSYQSSGHICHVDLFPVPPATDNVQEANVTKPKPRPVWPRTVVTPEVATDFSSSPTLTSPRISHPYSALPRGPGPSSPPPGTEPPQSASPTPPYPPPSRVRKRSSSASVQDSDGEPDPGVLAYFEDHAITDSSMCTKALAGTTIAQASPLEYHGKRVIMFVFSASIVRQILAF